MQRPPMREDITPLYRGIITTVRPVLRKVTAQRWSGEEHLPGTGGFVIASNHVSNFDHFPLAHFLVDHGRAPHFLAKSVLFDPPGLKQIMKGTGQIPVYRGTTRASDALSAATAALRGGACVCVYPEGTITKAAGYWPMTGKSGAARLALETGCPLVPMAIWGTQDILEPYAGLRLPKVIPPRPVTVRVGPALDLSDVRDERPTPAVLGEVTNRLMDAITGLLEEIRGQSAPSHRFDPRKDTPVRGKKSKKRSS
ncbi:lysophospholipid acyltransferase family protein [Luteipulveratus flavus]|uniref:Lysophospholipid acyltransferase family protein n=1 Tax=Luteipulveratus flavus TaxID=3031728 RepID=A0ABT6C6R5_9MICO|nr:lysophospholipid acyltransferase family protein [Luteipulveratus sp. YIM 133296]MDF8263769.1 lysophospholipid acyltransferase family protein [Luteipulveratus sp. YIM 133296]